MCFICRVLRMRSRTVVMYSPSMGNHASLDSPLQSWMNLLFSFGCDYQGKPTLDTAASTFCLPSINITELSLVIAWDHEIVKPIRWACVLRLLNPDWSLCYPMISVIEVQCGWKSYTLFHFISVISSALVLGKWPSVLSRIRMSSSSVTCGSSSLPWCI